MYNYRRKFAIHCGPFRTSKSKGNNWIELNQNGTYGHFLRADSSSSEATTTCDIFESGKGGGHRGSSYLLSNDFYQKSCLITKTRSTYVFICHDLLNIIASRLFFYFIVDI